MMMWIMVILMGYGVEETNSRDGDGERGGGRGRENDALRG